MEESILISIKKLLGLDAEYTAFDEDVKIHINTVLGILFQMGLGETPLVIRDDSTTWSDLIASETQLEIIKTFIYMRVRMMFDPPSSSSLATAMDATIKELEYRVYIIINDYYPEDSEGGA